MQELSFEQAQEVNGASACTTAFQMSYSFMGGALGAILGPAGAGAGATVGFAAGDILASYVCSK
ncbi:hypothetical protein PVT67_01215 [Gallaecimonas kandeliae]|uniref:hypothetical protein n=1 Tax=Gallaecimonas kandeliae TaxID=3029055 RepID=UPI0026475A94|nr:hypothetical protein [Gallaecimonas kandeliae]WKE65909.1 hypothetical protein PVT67_01215 [Gallaecimonas kandeliae]